MGRTVVAEDSLQDKLTALAKAGTFQIGILIGQSTNDRDFIVHLAPTPIPDEGDLSSEEEEALPSPKTEAKPKFPDSIAKVVDSTISQHTRQVVRMLPGGLDIIGIYVVTPQAEFNSSLSQSKLRSLLALAHRTASRILLDTAEVRTEKTILHVCSQTFKIFCKSVDVSPTAPSLPANAELKFQRGGIKWQQLSYSYNINLNFWLPKDRSTQSLYKTILTLIKPWAKNVTESLILIDSELPDDDEPLNSSVDEKPSKKKGGSRGIMELVPPKVFFAEILDSCAPLTSSNGLNESSGCIRLTGTLAGLAFVHSKATVGEARSAVLIDLVRSVVARWEMHCDSLVDEPPSHLVGPIIHEPPRRVFLEGGGLPVSLCDYLFPGDTCSDACQSAKELLSVRVRKEHVDDTLETHADAAEVMDGGDVDADGAQQLEGDGSSREETCSISYILLAVIIGVLGIGVSYIALLGTKALT
ncbi:protein odr-4 homolog isoform X1 [Homarus americanus]|uniref:protein odr-4 homolog isoform X1 n=1 Tax=Homarus americanus TaxID=6706 RepID=UPI001C49032C|nr:protein odr-4 homolog isoform X1 [Homarus americanus]XP_042220959.1 protein odr-4 homolog isoform X1 [Homarus americanus]